MDRQPTPRYCPQKTGEDVSTQIEPGDVSSVSQISLHFVQREFQLFFLPFLFSLQLFDFDFEVQPILEVLVGKTIEQALMEVLEEEEIAALKEQQRKFLELRAMEKAETRRLEEQERRLREEKVRESLESLFFSKCIKKIYIYFDRIND